MTWSEAKTDADGLKALLWRRHLTFDGAYRYFTNKAKRARKPERKQEHERTAQEALAMAQEALKEHQRL